MKVVVVSLVVLAVLPVRCVAQEYTRWGLPEGAKMRLGKGRLGDIEYSPDGRRIAVASFIGIWLYDAANLQEIALFRGHSGSNADVAFSPDGSMLASNAGYPVSSVRLWDAKTGELQRTLSGHTWIVNCVAFSPEREMLASGASDDTVRLWHPGRGNIYEHSRGIPAPF